LQDPEEVLEEVKREIIDYIIISQKEPIADSGQICAKYGCEAL